MKCFAVLLFDNSAAVATSIPLKLIDDPFLLRDAETLKYYGKKIGKAALFAAFAFDFIQWNKNKIVDNVSNKIKKIYRKYQKYCKWLYGNKE